LTDGRRGTRVSKVPEGPQAGCSVSTGEASRNLAMGSKMSPSLARPKRRGAPSHRRRPGWRCRGPSAAMASTAPASPRISSAPAPTVFHDLWERFADDGDLAGLKFLLLAAMIVLTALAEWGK
jgi:hypothetical protein